MKIRGKDARSEVQSKYSKIRDLLKRLIAVSDEIYNTTEIPNGDVFGLMATCFLAKQLHHGNTLMSLNENLDVLLVARVMLEGAAILIWTEKDPTERSKNWLNYLEVSYFKNVRGLGSIGGIVDSQVLESAKKSATVAGSKFIKGKGFPELKPDPFSNEWLPINRRQLFNDVGLEKYYEVIYRDFSEWEHWNVGAFTRLIEFSLTKSKLERMQNSTQTASSCTSVAFDSLIRTAKICNEYFKTGKTNRLETLELEYTKSVETK